MDIMDNIHSFFIHGYDTGFRTNILDEEQQEEIKNNDDDDNDDIMYCDKYMIKLNKHLKEKRKNLLNVRGIERVEHSKFVTKINNDDTS